MARIEIRNHRAFLNGNPVPFRQTPNGGAPLVPQGIICHDTAGDLPGKGSVNWLTDPAAKASAHFVIGYDGSITQLQALNRQCWHAGASQYRGRQNCNGFTIGIEIANPGAMVKFGAGYSNGGAAKPEKGVKVPASMDVRKASSPHHGLAYWLAYSDAQIATVTELCRAIAAAYNIQFITTHWDICIPKGRKVDTNPLFPLEELRANVLGARPVALVDESQGESDESGGDTQVADADTDEHLPAPTKPTFFRKVSTWVKAGLTSIGFGGVGLLTDWQIAAIAFGFALFLVLLCIGLAFWLFGKDSVREWVRKQVS